MILDGLGESRRCLADRRGEPLLRFRCIGPELPQGISQKFQDNRVVADRPRRGDRLLIGQTGVIFLATPALVERPKSPWEAVAFGPALLSTMR
jgi:hypothetical protein